MRWIVLLLVLANLGLAGWFLSAGRAPDTTMRQSSPVSADAGIALVSEVASEELARHNSQAATKAARGSGGARQASPAAGRDTAAAALCTLVGPFAEAYQGEDVAQRLQALAVAARSSAIEMQGQMRYWVYLAPLGSRREALRKLRELQSAGVDSYVIPKGSLENGISFGIFSELERAQALAADLKQQGFSVEYREEPQTYLEHWVVLEQGEEAKLAEDFWQQLQLDYPQTDRRQNLCSEIRTVEVAEE